MLLICDFSLWASEIDYNTAFTILKSEYFFLSVYDRVVSLQSKYF